MERTQNRWWDGLLCGCLILLSVIISFPFAEMGFNDDFSYVKTAFDYAQTGHLIYNGWAAPMLGWQAVWGSWFIKLFGFSFSAVRWSMLPVSLATAWLFFAVLTRFRISRRNAYFGTLLFGFSPLFIPLAASFMTDMSCEFVLLLCIYLCQRAVAAKTDAATIGWVAAAATTNAIGGTARQITWLGILVMVPATAWLLRKCRGVLIAGFIFWCLGAAFIFACVRWLNRQPYALPEEVLPQAKFSLAFMASRVGLDLIKEYFFLALLTLPILVAWMLRMKKLRLLPLAVILVLTGAFQFSSLKFNRDYHLLPWLHDFVGDLGLNSGDRFSWFLGRAPVVMNNQTRYMLSYIIMVIGVVFIVDLLRDRKGGAIKESIANWLKADPNLPSNQEFWILVPFFVAYFVLLIPRSIDSQVLDRYLFVPLPFVILWLLQLYQRRFSQPLPLISYAILAVIALFSVGGTHDEYALNRARLQAASVLLNSGVPDNKMMLGLDYDSRTQFKYFHAIAAPHARVPEWIYHASPRPDLPDDCVIWSWEMTPAVRPEYFVVFSPLPCLAPSHFAPISYHAWLPPFHRTIYIERHP